MRVRRLMVPALVVAAGTALRVWVYRSALGAPDSDEAIVGLMARHVLHGDLTTFYWGQPYGGSQEALLTAPVFAVAGESLLTLRVVTIGLTVLAAGLLWAVGRRLGGDRLGFVAASLFWLWPPFDVMWLVHERGFYASDVVYCTLLLLLALRIVEQPSRIRVAVFGFVLGLGFWQTAQIVPVALPLVVWTAWRAPRAVRHAWVGLAAAAVGASPWLVWNFGHGWASILPRASGAQYVHSLRLFISPLLPMLLGLRAPLTAEPLVPRPLMYLFYAVLLLLFVVGAIRARRTNASVLYFGALVLPFVWAIARRVTSETSKPLFLVAATPLLVLLVAQLGRTRLSAAMLLVVACATSVLTLHRMQHWFETSAAQYPPQLPRDLSSLVDVLDRHRVDRVFADYWIAFRLDFDTHERIVATNDAGEVRYPPYREVVAAAAHGYVFLRSERSSAPSAAELRRRRYRRHELGPFTVWTPP